MLSVADGGECGREEDRWKLWSRRSGFDREALHKKSNSLASAVPWEAE